MFFAKPRLGGALKHNQSYQTPRVYLFFSDCHGPAVTSWGIVLTVFTRLRLASDGGTSDDDRATTRRFCCRLSQTFLWSRQFSLTAIEVRSATSRERQIKSRTEIRRADKIELKNVTSSRRKLFVFRIMEIKNIYRFSRES